MSVDYVKRDLDLNEKVHWSEYIRIAKFSKGYWKPKNLSLSEMLFSICFSKLWICIACYVFWILGLIVWIWHYSF